MPYSIYVPQDSVSTEAGLAHAKFVTVDGYAQDEVTHAAFPRANYLSLPQTSSAAEMYDQLRFHKADAYISDNISGEKYMAANANTIRRISQAPLIAMRMFLVVSKGDADMKWFLDEHFSLDASLNANIMSYTLATYKMPEKSLLFGPRCKSGKTPAGWDVCVPDAGTSPLFAPAGT